MRAGFAALLFALLFVASAFGLPPDDVALDPELHKWLQVPAAALDRPPVLCSQRLQVCRLRSSQRTLRGGHRRLALRCAGRGLSCRGSPTQRARLWHATPSARSERPNTHAINRRTPSKYYASCRHVRHRRSIKAFGQHGRVHRRYRGSRCGPCHRAIALQPPRCRSVPPRNSRSSYRQGST